jgi:hypothetical protein
MILRPIIPPGIVSYIVMIVVQISPGGLHPQRIGQWIIVTFFIKLLQVFQPIGKKSLCRRGKVFFRRVWIAPIPQVQNQMRLQRGGKGFKGFFIASRGSSKSHERATTRKGETGGV